MFKVKVTAKVKNFMKSLCIFIFSDDQTRCADVLLVRVRGK